MTNWTISIPETPSPNFVIVKNIALESTEQTVKEFFLFCGKIKEFELKVDEEDEKHQVALIHFERESAAKTAALLSNALIDESHIIATPYFDIPAKEGSSEGQESKSTEQSAQEDKPKSRIAAEILANGYMLQDHVVAKGLEYDNKYNLSGRLTGLLSSFQSNVKQFDEKYRIWDKAVDLDQKYKIGEKVQNAAQTAQNTAQAALQTPTGQKVQDLAAQTFAQIAAVHYEAKKIQGEKLHSPSSSTTKTPVANDTKATHVYQDRENTYADRLNYFHKTVQANQRECCPRTDSACSKENDPDLRLKLHIQIQQATFGEDINDGIIVPAGGYLEVSQSEGIIYYGVYNMDGTAFPFETYSLY
ncbi:hypothetical protein [Parasitella parasitica]|uniref:RRM domain-containing protein n=1 Tax=Parasitella parasitica TaxID=35722 RepID=A0A0B7MXT7_9FUNG|nr:hypothetical protein [Parasitella parasitica]